MTASIDPSGRVESIASTQEVAADRIWKESIDEETIFPILVLGWGTSLPQSECKAHV